MFECLKNDNLGFEFVEKEYYLNMGNIKRTADIVEGLIIKYDNDLLITLQYNSGSRSKNTLNTLNRIIFEYHLNDDWISKYIYFKNNGEIENIEYYLNGDYIMNDEELNRYINSNKVLIKKINKLEFLYIVFKINNDVEKLYKISKKLIINKLS